MTLKYRFERHVRIMENGCHVWLGFKLKSGHGRFGINGKTYLTHRVARHLYCGFDLDSDILILHKNECNNPSCINLDHTYEGDHSDNAKDTVKNSTHYQTKKTHCPKGHEYTQRNTRIEIHGGRRCKKCDRERFHKIGHKNDI